MVRTRDDASAQAMELELKVDHALDLEAAPSCTASNIPEGVAPSDEEDGQHPSGIRGMTVAFQDVEYIVKNSAKWREKISILSKVSGSIPPGYLTALMGPSGSGKTTLLDVLAGRKTVGTINGTVVYAGHKASRSFLRRYTGYVEQFDTLLDNLTVEEMLMYTAEMKNPVRDSLASKKAKVALVMEQLALTSCKSVKIGNALDRGISGGQSKRTNIGLALVTNPRVLFLDEPTSGLDSFTANEVMSVVKGLMKTGMTICATIHSPTPFCFRLFDRMMILLRGHMAYAGPNGEAAVHYFEQTNPGYPRFGAGSTSDNHAEWIVDLTTKADRDGKALEFAQRYQASALCAANAGDLQRDLERREVSPQIAKELRARQGTSTPFYFGVKTILKYRLWRDLSDPTYLGPRVADKIVVGLILMSLYWHIGRENFGPNSVNIGAALFMVTILPAFAACAYTPQLVLERPVYYRERNDGCYTALTYLSAKIFEESLVALVTSTVFACIVFFPCEFSGSFALFWYTYFQTTLIGILLAYFIAAISPNMDVANGALPAFIVINLFFVGLLIRPQDQPKYWHWFQYIDFLHYSWTAQMINQFENTHIIIFLGIEILQFYDLRGKKKWDYVGFETVFIVVFFVWAWLALAFIRHQKR
ncbi:g2668 [Coccomyxa viridis]|uniref:G2668 protein n=1 Tax=Coccomyxa viridis TaxID=1274662 RepID=A0ABP1FKY3_9CHLO